MMKTIRHPTQYGWHDRTEEPVIFRPNDDAYYVRDRNTGTWMPVMRERDLVPKREREEYEVAG